jgi:GNAT superfamily N-acetyltransferase
VPYDAAVSATDHHAGTPLARFGATHRAAVRAEWAAAQAAGLDLRVIDDGTFLLGAAPGFPSTMFNRALGFAEFPERIGRAIEFFADVGVEGEIVLDPADIPPGVEPRVRLEAYLADPADMPPAPVDGLDIRLIDDREADTWMDLVIEGYAPSEDIAGLWRSMASQYATTTPDRDLLIGELDGRLVAASSLFVSQGRGWLSWATVLPAERGRGIQRAMIAARARVAAERGCEEIAAWALASAHSSRNLDRAGMPLIGERVAVSASDLT